MNEHIGELHPTNDGKYFYKIIDWVDNKNVTVELLNDNFQPHYTRTATYQRIRGHLAYPGAEIHHPNWVSQDQIERKAYWEGRVVETKDGTAKYEIVDYQDAHNIKIHFLDTLCYQMRDSSSLDKNRVANPFPVTDKGETVLYFGDPYKQYMGAYFYTTEGRRDLEAGRIPNPSDIYRIVYYGGKDNITIQFQDEYGYTYTTGLSDVTGGRVRNRYKRNQFGAYLGDTSLNYTNDEKQCFSMWRHMIERINNPQQFPSYINVLVADEWYDYSAFKKWYMYEMSQVKPDPTALYSIDKDLKYPFYYKSTNGHKSYGPQYSVIMPLDLNNTIKSLGKNNLKVKDITEYYRANGNISKDTYDLIMYMINNNIQYCARI